MSEPIYKTFVARRVTRRNAGIILMALGLALLFALPLSLRARMAVWFHLGGAVAILATGWWLFGSAYGAPTREVLVLAEERRAAITPADLVKDMGLELDNARAVLAKMTEEGILRRASNAEAYLVAGQSPSPPAK